MSKETIKMKSIRITRMGIKALLYAASDTAKHYRKVIAENWSKEDDAKCRKALYKAHKGLAKSRAMINECQTQLRATKREIRKLNHQHDAHLRAIELAKLASMAERTTLLE